MLELPPFVVLAQRPTPIERHAALSERLGIEFFVKRDDLTGAALSGNKVRKLEFLLADAQRQGAEHVFTCGWAHSNHCRATAVAARQLGLGATLYLKGAASEPWDQNRLLARWVGAELIFLDDAAYAGVGARMTEDATAHAHEHGRTPYIIPGGGSNALGALGYVEAAREIREYEHAHNARFAAIVFASGSGGTQAGLIAGVELHGLTARILGVVDDDYGGAFEPKVAGILEGIRERFFPALRASQSDVHLLRGHWGEGYGRSTPAERRFLVDAARKWGLLLDPVYTGKALAGLMARAEAGEFTPGARVLFVHTGGLFGVTEAQLAPYLEQTP